MTERKEKETSKGNATYQLTAGKYEDNEWFKRRY